jgi:hypothetical protein
MNILQGINTERILAQEIIVQVVEETTGTITGLAEEIIITGPAEEIIITTATSKKDINKFIYCFKTLVNFTDQGFFILHT